MGGQTAGQVGTLGLIRKTTTAEGQDHDDDDA